MIVLITRIQSCIVLCFDPSNSLFALDIKSLVKLVEFYPNEYEDNDLIVLENYITYVRSDHDFSKYGRD